MVIIAHPDQAEFAQSISVQRGIELGVVEYRKFPDGEIYLRLRSAVRGKKVIIVASLNHPDEKILWVYLLSQTLRAEGVDSIHLVAPYLSYMRQDCQFHEGESVTSRHIAGLLSSAVGRLSTIDPHLHRYKSLSEIYSIPTQVLHCASLISAWISKNISKPLLIGPDSESRQWTSDLAMRLNVPYLVLEKDRVGDRQVSVSIPDVHLYGDHTPILIDDIISTGRTMIETVNRLKATSLRPPICIGIHAVFADNAFEELQKSGCESIVTTNTIAHVSNQIDVSSLVVGAL